MRVLGVETSCDETAAAIVEDGTKIISNVVASSVNIHAKYGGIIPENAAREQAKAIIPVISEAINRANSTWHVARGKNNATSYELLATSQIEAIAVTVGPGLIGSLLVGVETAKTLAFAWNKPIIPVNHLIGHIYANWLIPENSTWHVAEQNNSQKLRATSHEPVLPAVVLLVSGGHTELILMKNHGKFAWLGGTRDDAAGECFDKCARLLGLGYPGGPAIEAAASEIPNSKFQIPKLPRPMINDQSLDFSFSGLKTAVRNAASPNHLTSYPPNFLAYELQEAVTDVLVKKTLLAAEKYKVKNILLAGGVAANKRLREKFQTKNSKFQILVPESKLCTDNAAYIASAAYFNYQPAPWSQIQADPSLDID